MRKTNRLMRARLLRDGEPGEPIGGGGGATPPNTDGLGDAGKAALDAERAKAKEEGRLRAAEKARADAAEAELAKIREANQSEHEKAIADARREAAAEVLTAANAKLIRAEVRTAAAVAKFRDPADAVQQLADQFGSIPVTDSGDVDEAAVAALVKGLAEAKPYLVDTGSSTGPRPLPGQGTPPAAPKTASVDAGRALYAARHKKT